MSDRTREAVRYSLAVFLAVRIALFIAGLIAVGIVPVREPVSVPGWPAPVAGGWGAVFTAWERFDALWFLRIASSGYGASDGSAAFFPLFPMLVRATAFALGGRTFAAGMLVSNGAFAAALIVLYLLTAHERSVETARTSVLLMAVFPSAIFFYAPFSEPLFLLLALTAFLAARRRSWFVAAVAAGLAALTRSVGIALAPALAIEALNQRKESESSAIAGLAASTAPEIGFGLYLAYWYARTGDALAPIHQQVNWQREFSWPWTTVINATNDVIDYAGRANGGYWAIDWLIFAAILGGSVFAALRYRPGYVAYTWVALLIPLVYIFQSRPLMSMPRFVLPLFPAFWGLAELAEARRIPRAAVAAVAAGGLGLLLVLFVNWYYIF